MAFYLFQASYPPDQIKAMIGKPQDRGEAARQKNRKGEMKTSAIFVVALVVFLSGCTSISYTPLSASYAPPTVAAEVETFFNNFPDKAFTVIGTVKVIGLRKVEGPGIFAKIRERAAAVGADAIIIKPGFEEIFGVRVLDSETGNTRILRTRKYVLTAVAIRWKESS